MNTLALKSSATARRQVVVPVSAKSYIAQCLGQARPLQDWHFCFSNDASKVNIMGHFGTSIFLVKDHIRAVLTTLFTIDRPKPCILNMQFVEYYSI